MVSEVVPVVEVVVLVVVILVVVEVVVGEIVVMVEWLRNQLPYYYWQ